MTYWVLLVIIINSTLWSFRFGRRRCIIYGWLGHVGSLVEGGNCSRWERIIVKRVGSRVLPYTRGGKRQHWNWQSSRILVKKKNSRGHRITSCRWELMYLYVQSWVLLVPIGLAFTVDSYIFFFFIIYYIYYNRNNNK